MHILYTLQEIKDLIQLVFSKPNNSQEYTNDLRLIFDMVDIEMEKIKSDPKLYMRSREIIEQKDPKIIELYNQFQKGQHSLLSLESLDPLILIKNKPDSLGYMYAKFIIDNNIGPTPVILKSPEETDFLDFYRARTLMFHDFVHVIFGLGVDMYGEFGTNGVYVSQIFNPASYLTLGTYIAKAFRTKNEKAIETMVQGFIAGHNAGSKSGKIGSFVWENYLNTNIEEVRKILNIEPIIYDPKTFLNFSGI